MTMETIITDGLTPESIFFCRYHADRESIPLVLVMGYGGSLNAWPRSFVKQLSKNQEVIIFDNRGTGRSHKPSSVSDFSVSYFARDLLGLLDHLKISKANLLGYSLGGCIALQLAQEHPERVNQLILMSTTAGGALYASPDQSTLNRLLNPQGSSTQEKFLDTFALCLSQSNIQKHEKLLSEIYELSCDHLPPRITFEGHFKAYGEFDAQTFLPKIRQPVKIIHGNNDRLTPVANAKKLAEQIAHAELIILDDCEHCPHIEHTSKVINEISSSLLPSAFSPT